MGKLQHHGRKFQVEIQNRFSVLASIPPDNFNLRDDAAAKMIHEAAISITGRCKSEKNPTSCQQVPNNSKRDEGK